MHQVFGSMHHGEPECHPYNRVHDGGRRQTRRNSVKQIPANWDLSGKVAVVTGAARGIGLSTAQLLRSRGAKIVATDRSEDVNKLAADDIAVLVGDASDEDVARRTMALAVERFGRLDILVNNAGRTLNVPLIDTTVEDFDR